MNRIDFRNYYYQLKNFENFLNNNRYSPIIIPMKVEFKDDNNPEVTTPNFKDGEYEEITCPYLYGNYNSYHYLRITAEFPNDLDQKDVFGIFDFGYGNDGLTIGTETIMYVDGNPYSGLDKNHREIPLNKKTGEVVMDFRIWSGVVSEDRVYEYHEIGGHIVNEKFHTIKQPIFATKNEITYKYYYLLKTILETYDAMKEQNKALATKLITDAYNAYLKIGMIADCDEKKIEASYKYLKNKLQKYGTNYPFNYKVVGQSHIDVVWLWQVKHTREKIARTFSSMLRLLENNDEFIYFQSQPILFHYLKQDYPYIFEEFQKYVDQGRIEIDGGMWLEADTNIPSGESLTRQIIHGKKFIKDNFNKESKILWMPDVFGYSPQLPQILKKCDVDYFYTTKMMWNKTNRMPHQTFFWEGIDGSQVLTHLQEDLDFFTVNMKSVANGWNLYQDSDIFNSLIYGYGYGDGGGGPVQGCLETIKSSNEIGILPKIEFSTVKDYFHGLEKDIDENEASDIHTWRGELYLELHRGTFTSQAKLKFYNRMIENKLRAVEMHVVKTFQDNKIVDGIMQEIDNIWEEFLLNQFHDIIPGSCIKEAVRDAEKLYFQVSDQLDELLSKIFANYNPTNEYRLLNPTNTNLDSIIDISNVNDVEGIEFGSKKFTYAKDLAPLAYNKVEIDMNNTITANVTYEYDFVKYSIKFDADFNITSLFNKVTNVEIVNGKFNELKIYEDKPLMWSAWDIDAYYTDKGYDVPILESANLEFENSDLLIIKVVKKYLNTTIEQLITLSKKSDFIDVRNNIDWNEPEKLLRVEFDNAIKCDNLVCDTQYGNHIRPTHANTSWEKAKFEFVAHKYVVVQDNNSGYALVNNGKYGFNYEKNTLGMTLIKTGINPDPKQDIGIHEFGYSIKLANSSFNNSDIEDYAMLYNSYNILVGYDIDETPILEMSNDNLAIDSYKVDELSKKLVLRVHDYKNEKMGINISKEITNVLNSLEEVVEYDLVVKNYEVKTFELEGNK